MIDKDHFEAMAAVFSVLARLHQEPPCDEQLAGLWTLLTDWPLQSIGSTAVGLGELRRSQSIPETDTAIRSDHASLYGRTAVAKVSPYESVHRGHDALLFDDQTLQVREAYRSLSLQAPLLNREPDDHIGLELNFLAQSCLKALDALDLNSASDAQRYAAVGAGFFREHLSQWGPAMLNNAADLAQTHFMRGICHLTLGAMEGYENIIAGAPVR